LPIAIPGFADPLPVLLAVTTGNPKIAGPFPIS